VGLGVVIIIATTLNSLRLKNILAVPLIKLIGKVSYGIYLCHTIMLALFTPMLIYWLNQFGVTNTVIVLTLAFISTATGSIIIAYILHRLVELRFIAIGKKVNELISSALKKPNKTSLSEVSGADV
jgi:peptidoglycan/LPS O-acetylase OafA/YrhL